MITGQRILDTLFPVGRGSRAALPGGFGTGKTVLQEALAKWSDADIIVYVGCGERGNEMSEVLDELPKLAGPAQRHGRSWSARSSSPTPPTCRSPRARRASTRRSRWRNTFATRDCTWRSWPIRPAAGRRPCGRSPGRLEEMPGEAGYPAYLSSRLAQFYERAGRMRTLAGAEGSVTIIGAISPPAGDFTEPVTMHTRRCVRAFWALDRGRAQARFFPAIHPLQSYSADVDALARWWQAQGNPDWSAQRKRLLELLEAQARLERMARIVGKDALPPAQQLTLLCADLVNDAVLRQSSFSETDRYCSPQRQTEILKRGDPLHRPGAQRRRRRRASGPYRRASHPPHLAAHRRGVRRGADTRDPRPVEAARLGVLQLAA